MVVVGIASPVVVGVSSQLGPSAPGSVQALAFVSLMLAMAFVLFVPGYAAALVLIRREPLLSRRPALLFGVVLLVSSLLWWLVFWSWVLAPVVGASLAVIGYGWGVWSSARIGSQWCRRSVPLLALCVLPLASVLLPAGIVYSRGAMPVPIESMQRLLIPTADNAFPLEWSTRVAEDMDLGAPALGGWSLSERPPVQAAFSMPFELVRADRQLVSQVTGSLLAGVALVGIVLLFSMVGLRGRRLAVAALLVALTGFMSVFTMYVMSKLFPAAVILVVMAVIIESTGDRRTRGALAGSLAWVVMAGLVAMAVVAHPVGMASLPMVVLLWLFFRSPPPAWSFAIGCVAIASAFGALWVTYRLMMGAEEGPSIIRWHLAGVTDAADTRSVLTAIVDEYGRLGIGGWFTQRWGNVLAALGWERIGNGLSGRSRWPIWAFNLSTINPLWSGGLLLFVLPVVVVRWRSLPRILRVMAIAAVVNLAGWIVLAFGPPSAATITYQSPFAVLVVLAIVLAATAVLILPPWVGRSILGLQAIIWAWMLWVISARDACTTMCQPSTYPEWMVRSGNVLLPVMALSAVGVALLLGAIWLWSQSIGNAGVTWRLSCSGSKSVETLPETSSQLTEWR